LVDTSRTKLFIGERAKERATKYIQESARINGYKKIEETSLFYICRYESKVFEQLNGSKTVYIMELFEFPYMYVFEE